MGTIDEEAASKFINALVKSVQTLCHGYLDFDSGIEIIGHINLSVDKVGSLDYILKEKVCKNNENSTLFISNSFHAQPKSEQTAKAKNSQSETVLQRRQSSDNESGRVSSAISSISSALSSAKESSANSTGSRPQQSTAKRKAHDDLNNDHRPAKSVSRDAHHFLSSHSQPSPHDTRSSSPIDSKPAISGVSAGFDSSPRTSSADGSATLLPQTANVTSDNQSELDVNLEGSVLEPVDDQSNSEMPERDDSDLDLEVTFIKEEFVEGERSACEFQGSGGGQQYGRTSHQRASTSSDGMGEQPLFPVALHSSASATYVPGSQDMVGLAQHYAGSHGSSTSQPQPGPSGMRGNLVQQQAVQPLPPGTRPGCGYVHPNDAKIWQMYELVPGSGVYIHQENYRTVMSKERDGQPDGKAMARYLMSCFWKQSDLVGASIAEPPRPHHRSLDKGIINAILDLCRQLTGCSKRDVQRAMWWKISAANTATRRRGVGLSGQSGMIEEGNVGPMMAALSSARLPFPFSLHSSDPRDASQ